MQTVSADSFGDAISEAKDLCKNGPQQNLTISIQNVSPYSLESFLETFRTDAEQWQSPVKPDNFHFNHGEYIHRNGDALDHLTEELIRKPSSNRACFVLPDNRDVANSGDGKLPSFMLGQAGISSNDANKLIISAYFRALEVGTFLPINLTELCLIAKRISTKIPRLQTLDVVLYAFRAHHTPSFRTHRKSLLDIAENSMEHTVDLGDPNIIADWLADKALPESIIETGGLAKLVEISRKKGWGNSVAELLEEALLSLTILKELRESGSDAQSIDTHQKDLSLSLRSASNTIRKSGI